MAKSDPGDVASSIKLKNTPDYPHNKIKLDEELANNKTIQKIEKHFVNRTANTTLTTLTTKFATYTFIGGVMTGVFYFVIQPWLIASGGSHLNYVNKSIMTKRSSVKLVKYSCKAKSTSLHTAVGIHPYEAEISNWVEHNGEGSHVTPHDPENFEPVPGYYPCSEMDVQHYGPCGGFGNMRAGNPLAALVNLENIEAGSSITCDEVPNIFEAVVDTVLSSGTTLVGDILDNAVDIGSSLATNTVERIILHPFSAALFAVGVGYIVMRLTRNKWLSLMAFAVAFVVYLGAIFLLNLKRTHSSTTLSQLHHEPKYIPNIIEWFSQNIIISTTLKNKMRGSVGGGVANFIKFLVMHGEIRRRRDTKCISAKEHLKRSQDDMLRYSEGDIKTSGERSLKLRRLSRIAQHQAKKDLIESAPGIQLIL